MTALSSCCSLCGSVFEARTSYSLCAQCFSRDTARELDRIESLRRQMHRAGLPDRLTLLQWIATVADFRGRCALCLKMPFTHIELFIYERGLVYENVFPCCPACAVHLHTSFPLAVQRVATYLEQDDGEEGVGV